MTDLMKLAEAYAWHSVHGAGTTGESVIGARDALHEAIEALQAENERLKEEAKQWQDLSELSLGMAEAHSKERDALAAQLDAMGKGEALSELAERIEGIIACNMYGVYHCTRVWEAWSVGTMSEEDFESYAESDSPRELAEMIAEALQSAQAPKALAPEPLTDEQAIEALWKARSKWMEEAGIDTEGIQHHLPTLYAMLPYFRAGEAAHGIHAKGGQHD